MSLTYTYAGLSLIYGQTTQFSMEQEYDPSGTDAIRNHYIIRVKGFISTTGGTLPAVSTGTTLASTANVKALLESPRRPFFYNIGTATVISIPTGLDAKLGPKPMPATVTQVNSGYFFVECGMECWTVDCGNECEGQRSPVLSLRWTQTESFDESWNSNLKTSGLLIVRSDLRQCADNFRQLATPGILPDYRRLSASYTLSEDGLQLEFEFVDKEEDRLPPFPSIKAQGKYSVEVMKPGLIRMGTCSVSLEGQKGTDRRLLMSKAINMCYSKLERDTIQNADKPIWSGRFDEDLFVPRVSVSITARMSPLGGDRFAGVLESGTGGGVAGAFGVAVTPVPVMPSVGQQTFGLQSNQPGLMPPQRKRLARLLVAAFRDPCACLEAEIALTSSGSPGNAPVNPKITSLTAGAPVPAPPTASIAIGIINQAAGSIASGVVDYSPYDWYTVNIATAVITGIVQLPGTGVGPNGGVSKVVTSSGPMMKIITSWVAGRTGKPPQLPTFYPPDPNIVPLEGSVVAADVTPSPDGSQLVFLLSGYYVHAVLDPSKYQIVPGVAPFYGDKIFQGAQAAADYWTNSSLWQGQQGASNGSQPLIPNGVVPGTTPQFPPQFQQAPQTYTNTPQSANQGNGIDIPGIFIQQVNQ